MITTIYLILQGLAVCTICIFKLPIWVELLPVYIAFTHIALLIWQLLKVENEISEKEKNKMR